ncbi:MAG: ABC transporter permease subunit [Spirochaetes bacterium]|nr:ABC transporter permease subunit [Spirochaetota bacterium]
MRAILSPGFLKYLVRRLFSMIVTVFIIITLLFFIMRLAPGSPFDKEKPMPEAIRKALEAKYNLDKPMFVQYYLYLKDLILKGDFGPSMKYKGFTVNELLKAKFPVSFYIGLITIIYSIIVGIIFGIISAIYQNKWPDYLFMGFAVIGISMPSFLITILFLLLFAKVLKFVPFIWENGNPLSYVVPVLSLSMAEIAYITRLTKVGILDTLHQDYIRTARAKGLPESKVIIKHVLKGSLIPTVTFIGPAFAAIVTGSVVVEQICNIPGIGRDYVQAAFNRDYPVFMGVMIVYSALLILMNFVVDIVYAFLDPRIKYN